MKPTRRVPVHVTVEHRTKAGELVHTWTIQRDAAVPTGVKPDTTLSVDVDALVEGRWYTVPVRWRASRPSVSQRVVFTVAPKQVEVSKVSRDAAGSMIGIVKELY